MNRGVGSGDAGVAARPVVRPEPSAAPRAGDLASFAAEHLRLLDEWLEPMLLSAGRLGGGFHDATAVALGVRGARGRRWRPLLVLAAADALGRSPRDLAGIAAAVELTHTASLVLDDMPCMDDSERRRGEAAAHVAIGSGGAILLSVACLAEAARLLGGAPADAGSIAREWGEMVGLEGMAGGQAMDLAAGRRGLAGARRRLHRQKSTALPSFALAAAARAVGADPSVREDLRAFGRDLGWAYQLADDANDRIEDEARGLAPGGRRPARQSRRILDRARRRLGRSDGIAARGRALLLDLGDAVVDGRAFPAGRAA